MPLCIMNQEMLTLLVDQSINALKISETFFVTLYHMRLSLVMIVMNQ